MAIERGNIYLVDLNPVQGREQAGRRPVLVPCEIVFSRLKTSFVPISQGSKAQ